MNTEPNSSPERELIKTFEAGGVVDYLEYLKSGKRVFWVNFKAGIARGLGVTVGMTVVLGIVVWILTMLIRLPVVGEYFAEAKTIVIEYADSTNYEDEFAEMIEILEEIKSSSAPVDASPSSTD